MPSCCHACLLLRQSLHRITRRRMYRRGSRYVNTRTRRRRSTRERRSSSISGSVYSVSRLSSPNNFCSRRLPTRFQTAASLANDSIQSKANLPNPRLFFVAITPEERKVWFPDIYRDKCLIIFVHSVRSVRATLRKLFIP